eukprot:324293-Ditylum_brightwellii.AAC.1
MQVMDTTAYIQSVCSKVCSTSRDIYSPVGSEINLGNLLNTAHFNPTSNPIQCAQSLLDLY